MSDLSPGDFAELERLFHRAVELPAADRAAFVERTTADRPWLADRLAALLAADAGGDTLRQIIAQEARAVPGPDPLIGERFGAYRVERVIGRGGMGAVYLGHRADDAFEQEVAIKTILAGLASSSALERFRRERGILARLNHPNIARLLDGGSGPGGVPFVAMEFVAGVPITQYAADHGAGLRGRLELLLDLCGAVDFVHRNLIVHRDIKPGNVLVTAEGQVKLLDFGIAKLINEFESAPAPTATGLRAMTPEYASPEQILGQPVTTAADIYSLGVLAYELVTGVRPLQFSSTSPYELAQEIVAKTPLAPSETLRRSDSAAFAEAPARIARELRGDLDRIVLMALRKEPDRRYASVAALAADVRAWLAGRPVAAQTDTWQYRLRKRVRRHPVATGAAVLVAAIVVGFTALTVRQSRAIKVERDAALVEAQRSKATSDFLVNLFRASNPRERGTRNMTAFDLLQTGVADLRANTTLEPQVRSDLFLELGLSLSNLDALDAGTQSLRASLAESDRAYGRDSLESAECLQRLGDVLRRARKFDEALAALTEALAIRRRHMKTETHEIADSYNNLAILAIEMGQYVESDRLQTESVAMHTRLSGDPSPEIGVPLNNLALLKRRQGHYQEALALATRAHQILRTANDRDSTWLAEINIARTQRSMGSVDVAQGMFEDTLARVRAELGPNHTRTISIELDLAEGLRLKGDNEAASRRYDDLEPRIRAALGNDSVYLALLLHDRGLLDGSRGRLKTAERELREALDRQLAATGPRHYRVPEFRRDLSDVLADTGQLEGAERQARESIALLPDPKIYPHVELGRGLTTLARILRLAGRREEARSALAEARQVIRQTTGEQSDEMARVKAESGLLAAS